MMPTGLIRRWQRIVGMRGWDIIGITASWALQFPRWLDRFPMVFWAFRVLKTVGFFVAILLATVTLHTASSLRKRIQGFHSLRLGRLRRRSRKVCFFVDKHNYAFTQRLVHSLYNLNRYMKFAAQTTQKGAKLFFILNSLLLQVEIQAHINVPENAEHSHHVLCSVSGIFAEDHLGLRGQRFHVGFLVCPTPLSDWLCPSKVLRMIRVQGKNCR